MSERLAGRTGPSTQRRRGRSDAKWFASDRGLVSPMAMRQRSSKVIYWSVWSLLVLATLATMIPLYWLFTGALKTPLEITQVPPAWWPQSPTFENYLNAWTQLDFVKYFGNTVAVAVGTVVTRVVVSVLAAYALSKLMPRGTRLVLALLLSTLMVPYIVYFIPQYLTVARLPLLDISLLNTWWAVWLPGAVSAFSIFVLKLFFDQIPDELTDAARVDGANTWQTLWRVLLPLCRAPLAIVVIFTVIDSWKDFLWPYLVLPSEDLQPVSVALYQISGASTSAPLNLQIAAMAIASIPMIVLFLVFQRQIVRGVAFTGIKG